MGQYQIPGARAFLEQGGSGQATSHVVGGQPEAIGWARQTQRVRNMPGAVPYLTTTATAVTSSLDWMQASVDVYAT